MPRTKLVATTVATVEVKLSPRARQMVIQRCKEHAQLAAQVKDIKGTKTHPGRMKRIETEVDALFMKEKQGQALLDGTSIDGHRIKLVMGSRGVFDKHGFMKKHGLTEADFDAFTTLHDNEPYLRISAPGARDDE